jgi:hypothetical protein
LKFVLRFFSSSKKASDTWYPFLQLFFVEVIVLLTVQFVSLPFAYPCSGVLSLGHFPVVAKPMCGVSSVNLLTPWFAVFALVTLTAWSVLLTKNNYSFFEFTMSVKKKLA